MKGKYLKKRKMCVYSMAKKLTNIIHYNIKQDFNKF